MKTLWILPLLVLLFAGTRGDSLAADDTSPSQLEAEMTRVLDDYMSAWNRKDLAAWESTFQFPHYRLASGKMTVLERPGQQNPAQVWASAGSCFDPSGKDGSSSLI